MEIVVLGSKPTMCICNLGFVYFDIKWFPSKNIFREVIFPENVFGKKYFMVFTARTENQKNYIYISLNHIKL
jgi:hypothetical protein